MLKLAQEMSYGYAVILTTGSAHFSGVQLYEEMISYTIYGNKGSKV